MHAFLSNLANRQADTQTSRAIEFTSSVVGGNKRLHLRYCAVEADHRKARSIAYERLDQIGSLYAIENVTANTYLPKFTTFVMYKVQNYYI